MLDEFFIKGWTRFEEPELEKRDDIAEYLGKKYLFVWPKHELIELREATGISWLDRITRWHNDAKHGMNITFLYYVNTMEPETGGSISIRNTLADIEEQIYPTAGTLVMMSQKPHIEHKAEKCKIRRHMFNIDYLVDGF